ncbi:MAG: hypothetical protein OEY49_19575 [Candidatus Heimdallarchaeota archaeon]|nr:hypothetical protein [Candidatus Heimdallarchaeota archaeon]
MAVSTIDPQELTKLYNLVKSASTEGDDHYLYEGNAEEILSALEKLSQFGFADGNKLTKYPADALPWDTW